MYKCTIIWPHYPETLAPGGGVDLPSAHATYDDYIIDTLPNFRVPRLDTLVVRSEAWNNYGGAGSSDPRAGGFAQAARALSRYAMPRPASHSGAIHAAGIGRVPPRPGAARQSQQEGRHLAPGDKGQELTDRLPTHTVCPSLKTFGIRYRRWHREDERDEIRQLLHKIIESTTKTDTVL